MSDKLMAAIDGLIEEYFDGSVNYNLNEEDLTVKVNYRLYCVSIVEDTITMYPYGTHSHEEVLTHTY